MQQKHQNENVSNSDWSPAEIAAQQAEKEVMDCIDKKKSFILEAGAGAGKTYALIQALHYLIKSKKKILSLNSQKIACITYTNVAAAEIKSRIDSNPLVVSETIHSFCWSLIKDFQSYIRTKLPTIGKWALRINEANSIGRKPIKYELGYPKIKDDEVLLGHDDVINLTINLLSENKFRKLFVNRFPILLIDEYQDTDKNFTDTLIKYFLNIDEGLLIGFFGDHWQKIYGNGCGEINNINLKVIEKRANFRSSKIIVDCLNMIRPELTQEINDKLPEGTVSVFHTNNWVGQRRNENHWKEDLPQNEAHIKLDLVRAMLSSEAWDFNPESTKILMLTHNILAEEQGYKNLAKVFSRTESFIKKEDKIIAFFTETLEPLLAAYEAKQFHEIFTVLGDKSFIKTQSDKIKMTTELSKLLELRKTGTIADVIDYLISINAIYLPEIIKNKEEGLSFLEVANSKLSSDEIKSLERYKKIREIKYSEVSALTKFIDEKTPFSTKHGVKGAEFENVLVVLGGGWNMYNFNQMLEWVSMGVPIGKEEAFERYRNLFYVACSRPKRRLALLFTQKLSNEALKTLSSWFTDEAIIAI